MCKITSSEINEACLMCSYIHNRALLQVDLELIRHTKERL